MLTAYISYQMHMASIYILSQKTGCQRLSSYQLYSPRTVYLLKKSHNIIKGCLVARMHMIMKTCGRWEACLVNEKLETSASCFSSCFSSALGVSSFLLPPNEVLSAHFPPPFSYTHDSPMAVQATWEPHAVVGIAHATSTGWLGLRSSSRCGRKGRAAPQSDCST